MKSLDGAFPFPVSLFVNEDTDPASQAIDFLHRSPDGNVVLTVNRENPIAKRERERYLENTGKDIDPEHMYHLLSASPEIVKRAITEVQDKLYMDAFFTLNSTHPPAPKKRSKANPHFPDLEGGSLPWGAGIRGESLTKYLNGIWVDLDLWEKGLTFGQGYDSLKAKIDSGILPRPTVLVDSGRGIWALWLLVDIDTFKGVPVTPESLTLWRDISKKVVSLCEDLGADSKASTDPTRVGRIPGTGNSKADGKTAVWLPYLDSDKGLAYYYLWEIADFFGVGLEETPLEIAGNIIPFPHPPSTKPAIKSVVEYAPRPVSKCPKRRAGKVALWAKRLRLLELLIDKRGVSKQGEGVRFNTAFLYALILKHNGTPVPQIFNKVLDYGQNRCEPPLTERECKHQVESALVKKRVKTEGEGEREMLRYYRYSNARLAQMLHITPEESAYLGGLLPAEGETIPEPRKVGLEKQKHRRAELKRIAETFTKNGFRLPPIITLREILLNEAGISANIRTVIGDLKALKIRNPRSWKKKTVSPVLFREKSESE